MRLLPLFSFVRLASIGVFCLPAAALVASPYSVSAQVETPSNVVRLISEKGLKDILAANIAEKEKIDRFRTLFSDYFDVPSIGRFVLGRYWRNGSPDAQARFIDLFREINVYTWSRRFQDYNGQKMVIVGETPDDEKGAYVETRIDQPGGKAPVTVRWRLRLRPEGWRVVDLIVENVSMAITYRADYDSLMSQPSMTIEKLNGVLEQQLQSLQQSLPS